jgi:hypothetical protein
MDTKKAQNIRACQHTASGQHVLQAMIRSHTRLRAQPTPGKMCEYVACPTPADCQAACSSFQMWVLPAAAEPTRMAAPPTRRAMSSCTAALNWLFVICRAACKVVASAGRLQHGSYIAPYTSLSRNSRVLLVTMHLFARIMNSNDLSIGTISCSLGGCDPHDLHVLLGILSNSQHQQQQ